MDSGPADGKHTRLLAAIEQHAMRRESIQVNRSGALSSSSRVLTTSGSDTIRHANSSTRSANTTTNGWMDGWRYQETTERDICVKPGEPICITAKAAQQAHLIPQATNYRPTDWLVGWFVRLLLLAKAL